jgi:oxygen-independent coproporphyrinogen-3 oxidase
MQVNPETPASELTRRMARPQRHRLLHGYPMAPLLETTVLQPLPPQRAFAWDEGRPLIAGVLPHTFCNPSVRGCGFCTFAHETYSNDAARAVTARVAREIRAMAAAFPELVARRIDALYFGGGTANLTPPDAFAELTSALVDTLGPSLREAEVTLEGAPRYFLTRSEALLDVLAALPVRQRRISAGIQTFDEDWLARMGRTAFGNATDFASVVRAARGRGMTTSCDLLFNLPGQPLAASLEDVRRAVELGFDQICIYNLVLDESIDSAWASSRSLLARRPDTAEACARWLVLRAALLEAGYVQTTLTNFEKEDVHATSRRFLYEAASFEPDRYDAIGFGPGAISTFTAKARDGAIKWMNAATSDAYVAAIDEPEAAACARSFVYDATDLRLLHVTRSLARFTVDRERYRAFFGTDVQRDFAPELGAAADAGLLVVDPRAVTLTPRGMFYADAVAGLLAAGRVRLLRRGTNDSIMHAMG